MEDEKIILELYESTRCLLLSTENIGNIINELKNVKLKNHLSEYLNTAVADLMILSDLIFEISSCLDEDDIAYLLNCADNSDSLTDETTFQVN